VTVLKKLVGLAVASTLILGVSNTATATVTSVPTESTIVYSENDVSICIDLANELNSTIYAMSDGSLVEFYSHIITTSFEISLEYMTEFEDFENADLEMIEEELELVLAEIASNPAELRTDLDVGADFESCSDYDIKDLGFGLEATELYNAGQIDALEDLLAAIFEEEMANVGDMMDGEMMDDEMFDALEEVMEDQMSDPLEETMEDTPPTTVVVLEEATEAGTAQPAQAVTASPSYTG